MHSSFVKLIEIVKLDRDQIGLRDVNVVIDDSLTPFCEHHTLSLSLLLLTLILASSLTESSINSLKLPKRHTKHFKLRIGSYYGVVTFFSKFKASIGKQLTIRFLRR